jgi:serine/threonine protein kinase
MNYKNTNSWSPPEVLQNDKPFNDNTNNNNMSMQSDKVGFDQRSIDVYSFGIILWEIETEQVPFEGMNELEVKNIVIDQSLRPQIPRTCDSNLAYLIRSCWQKRPEKRVNFEYIFNFLEKVQFSS